MPTIAALPQSRAIAVARPSCAAAAVARPQVPSGAVVSIAELVIEGAANATTPFAQTTPSTTWTLAHGLNRFPSVTIVDTAGDICIADVVYVNANTITIEFGAPTSGTAYLN